jgi:hypothetical protein
MESPSTTEDAEDRRKNPAEVIACFMLVPVTT